MRKKILLAISALLLLGLAVAGFAYTSTNISAKAAMSCCCSGDSCPMKSKDGKDNTGKDAASCCGKDDCCKGGSCSSGSSCCGGDSCPMKGKDDGKSTDKAKPSCCDKDQESPKKDGEAAATEPDRKNVVFAAGTESCCCSCCGAKKDK